MTNPIDMLILSIAAFERDSDDGFERAIAKIRDTYYQSYRQGRGIKRLLCFTIGLLPFLAIVWTGCLLALLYQFGAWLVMSKDDFAEWREGRLE